LPDTYSWELVEHSHSKDEFLRVAIKTLAEIITLVAKLKEVTELNEVLLDRNQDLEA
jgi:hypothetical protein